MKTVVTGAAGFIGSHLCERLVGDGHEVVGIDSFNDVYPSDLKEANVSALLRRESFQLHRSDLRTADLSEVLEDYDVVFHLAAIPGVRASWEDGFRLYAENNILATQRLLEAIRPHPAIRLVYASSSSVYGNATRYPVREDDPPRPLSPYGVSKLSAEHLCNTYVEAFGLHAVSLRFFSVYGPRQRPDMGIHRLIEAGLGGHSFPLYGTGGNVRDMTYVGDVVEACVHAAQHGPEPGSIFNVAGGSEVSLLEVIQTLERLLGREIALDRQSAQPGDVDRTSGDTTRIREEINWRPVVELEEGLIKQIAFHRDRHNGDLRARGRQETSA